MTTTTRQPAPTRAEIEDAWRRPAPGGPSAAVRFSDGFTEASAIGGDLYDFDELRGSEAVRLDKLVEAALLRIRDRVAEELLDALADALATFSTEFPDAPRRPAA